MHDSSYDSMERFVKSLPKKGGMVLDVGSMDVNGTYRDLFDKKWKYIGMDVLPGKNVDYVPDNQYKWTGLKSRSFDLVICGQVLEHIEDDFAVTIEMYRVLKPGGLCCIIAPSEGPKHGYPKDYRRYSVNSLMDLMLDADFEIIKTWRNNALPWFDIVAIGKK